MHWPRQADLEQSVALHPLDLLRQWHSKLEEWILEQAGVPHAAEHEPATLRVVNCG